MLDGTRRLLALLVLLLAFVGLLPVLPNVQAYYSAVVTNRTSGTFFPAASPSPSSRFLSCSQYQATYQLRRNRSYTGNFFRCTNNWNSPIDVDISLVNGNSLVSAADSTATVTIPAGGAACVNATLTAFNVTGGPSTVVYKATANAANASADFYGEFEFTGQIQNIATNPTHVYCP